MFDCLYHNLPAVWDGEGYIVFSPYAQKVARLSSQEMESIQTKDILKSLKFFSPHSNLSHKDEIVKVGLNLTTDCNLRCIYCYAKGGENPLYMSPEYAVRVIREVVSTSTKELYVSFSGGEPTLNMNALKAVVKYVINSGLKTYFHISKNGIIEDTSLNYLIKNNFSITVSIDGIPEVQKYHRPQVNSNTLPVRLKTTIKKLVKNKIHFQVRSTVTTKNIDKMQESIEYWSDLGVRYIHIEIVSLTGRALEFTSLLPGVERYIETFKKILDMAEQRGVYVINSAYMNLLTPSDYFCTTVKGEKYLFNPDGSISLCYKIQNGNNGFRDLIIGLYDKKKDVFSFDKGRQDRMTEISINHYEECKNCFAKYLCGSGCPYRNFVSTGGWNKVASEMCKIRKELIRDAILRIYKMSRKEKESTVLGSIVYEAFLKKGGSQ